jgi:cytochrome c biogenesis protein CcmG, thiol:disulfide interchange protein DsbE
MNMSLVKKSLFASALALCVCASTAMAGGKSFKVGDAFPDLTTFQLEGKLPAELKGKVVLLDFWASWCGPCKESFPVMEDLHKKYGEKGFVILAVNVDENAAAMNDFLKEHAASFTIVHDGTKKLVGTANISSMPSSFILDQDGKVAAVHKGFHGKDTVKQYEAEIEKLLSPATATK